MRACRTTLLLGVAILTAGRLAAQDAYEALISDDFVEQTTFRFRTKFNRTFVDTDDFKTLLSRRTDVPPLLDGMLEDPCWKMADHTKSAFIQWLTKEPNRKQTVVYACHDDENLYLAIVCEEPRTKAVRMLSTHPGGRQTWKTAGQGDGIEAFVEMGGVGGTGQVYQFIFNIHPAVRYDGLYPPYVPLIGTGYNLGGALGAKRWVCELAFPHHGFNTDRTDRVNYRYEGPPRRGEVWGLRVVRNGPNPQHGEDQMRSTWTYNPTRSWHIPYPTGIIVFEHRNALYNGKLNEVEPETSRPRGWRLERRGDGVEADLSFHADAGHAILATKVSKLDEGALATQKIGVLPNVGYKLTARVKKLAGTAKVTVGIDKPLNQHEFRGLGEWEKHEVDFFSEPNQREATVFISATGGSGSAAIDEIRVEQQIYGAPTGATCLTGNSPRADLNLDEKALTAVKYSYREPGTDKEEFPYRKEWTAGWVHGQPDVGGSTGWIAAQAGSLTRPDLAREMIQWSHPRPSAGYVPYPKGHELIFDFGKEYYIRSVEFLPSGTIHNATVHVQAEGGKEFILTRKLRGEGVLNPPGPVLYGRLRRINSVCRYVKIWFGDGGHGCYFVRIWGEEKKDRSGISRFRWKEGLVVPEQKYQQFRKLEGPVLMPTPQEVEWGEGEFVVTNGTPVYYRDEGRGQQVVNCLVSELDAMFGLKLRPLKEAGNEELSVAKGAIVLGEVPSGGLATRLANARGWKIDAERPGSQGYFLSSAPGGVLICGFDQPGTFYGVQTLLQLAIQRDATSAAARSVEIRDWPYIPWRILDCRGGLTVPLIRALARLKVNVVMGRDHRACHDYFLRALPGWAGHSGGGPIEMDDDENWYYLGCGAAAYARINACPSHYQRYEFYERAGRREDAGARAGAININTDEMDGARGGSRWNSDRQCLRRKMTGDELFAEMVLRAYDLFRLHNRKTALLDTMMVAGFEGGNGAYHEMYKAYDRIPEDIHVFCWKGITGDPRSDPEEAVRRFDRTTMLQSSFPLQGRGRLNEFYKAPPGKRVWGTWNTVWGTAGPVDQVLTGQFCRSMTMVDGGFNVPFMSQGWNPDSPPIHTNEWALKVGHFQQRFGELALERQLPSWRDGVEKRFFKVDLRRSCNWSHIDEVPGDGKDWLDWGPNNDLRHMPRGEVQFEEVPFRVINPTQNGGKSVVMVKSWSKTERLRLPDTSAEIPVGRKAASLVFLRTNIDGGHAPGYRITYKGGRYLTIPLEAMGNQSRKYSCYGLYAPGKPSRAPDDPRAFYRSARHQMVELYSLFHRLAWLGTTGAGDPVKVTLHEWVNPRPELVIESVSVRYPRGRQSGRIEVLLAITGVEPTPRDLVLWQGRPKLPLVPLSKAAIEPTDTPVIPADGEWREKKGEPKTYLHAEGKEVCQVEKGFVALDKSTNNRNFFMPMDNTCLGDGGTIKLAFPQICKKVAVRGLFYWEYHGPKVHYGVSMLRRTDYVIEISSDGNAWSEVARKQGICGEDGEHVHSLPATPVQYLRVKLDARPYRSLTNPYYERNPYACAGAGLTTLQLYK